MRTLPFRLSPIREGSGMPACPKWGGSTAASVTAMDAAVISHYLPLCLLRARLTSGTIAPGTMTPGMVRTVALRFPLISLDC